jgi:hypothetical protein
VPKGEDKIMILLALLLQSAQPSAPVPAPPPEMHGGLQPMTCPLGGERFSAWQPSHYGFYGSRPDGKPYSSISFPLPIPECPSKRLLVFDKFSEAELARLPALLGSADYKRMIGSETPYYRAAWLATKLGRPESQALGLLLTATWEASGERSRAPQDPGRWRRYQHEFAERVQALPASVEAEARVGLQARAANALRQLGSFDDAERMRLDALDSLKAVGGNEGLSQYLRALAAPIDRRDDNVEPLDLVPPRIAASICARAPQASDDFDRDYCARPELRPMIEQGRKASPGAR